MTPTAYIIAQDTKDSQRLAKQTAQTLTTHSYSYELWPAVDGRSLTRAAWDNIGVELLDRGKIIRRPGAQGCFHSHFGLWQQCIDLNQPIIILEHDALAQAAFPRNLDLDRCVWKLWTSAPCKENDITSTWSRGAWAYTITPTQAQKLIAFTRLNGAQALDKQIGSRAVDWQFVGQDLFKHNPLPRPSTTSPSGPNTYLL